MDEAHHHPGNVKNAGEASKAIGGVSKHGRIVLRAEEFYMSGTVRYLSTCSSKYYRF